MEPEERKKAISTALAVLVFAQVPLQVRLGIAALAEEVDALGARLAQLEKGASQ